MTETKTGMLEESPGIVSSKRVAGVAMIVLGALMLVFIGVVSLYKFEPMPNAQVSLAAASTLVITGAGLLGSTVLEGIGGRVGGGV